jgi:prolyl oligopeptidase
VQILLQKSFCTHDQNFFWLEGGSNGGLLIANMLTRYPERFGALFCTVPLIDMRRYTKLLVGAWGIDEYGDPDKPEDWKFLSGLSAYHVAAPGKPYPPILIATSRRDDRAHPGHARKMAVFCFAHCPRC